MPRLGLPHPRLLLTGRARKLGGSLFASGTAQVLLTMSGVLVARGLGPEDRGYLALIVVVSGICVLVGSVGLPTAVTYYVARRPAGARAVTRTLAAPFLGQTAATILVQLAVLYAFVHDDPRRVEVAALVSILLVPGILCHSYGLAILQGQERFRPFNVLRILPTAVYAFAVLAVFVLGLADLVVLMTTWAMSLLLGGVLALAVALRGLPAEDEFAEGPGRRRLIRFGLKSLVGSTSPIEALRLDQALVGLLLTPVTLGLYVVAQAFTNLPRVVALSVGMVAYPHVASQPDQAAGRRALWRYFFIGVTVAGVVIAVLEVGSAQLVHIFFGDEFQAATPIARVLLVATLFMCARRVLTDGVNGLGRPGLGTLAEVVSWVLLVPTIAVLLPTHGAVGVALALAISWFLSLLLLIGLVLASARPWFAALEMRLANSWPPSTVAVVRGLAIATAVVCGLAVAVLPGRAALLLVGLVAAVCLFALGRSAFSRWSSSFFGSALRTYAAEPVEEAEELQEDGMRFGRFLFYAGVLLVAILTLRVGGQLTYSDAFFFLALAFVVAEVLVSRRPVPVGIPPLLLVGMGLFSVGGLLSTFGAEAPIKSAAVVARLIFLTVFWFWVAAVVLDRRERVQKAITLWVVSAGLAGAAGLLQLVAGDVIPNTSPVFGRSTGLTTQPNDLGGLTAVAFVPALMLATRSELSARKRLLLVGVLFAIGGGLISSGSVGALLAVGAAMFVWFAVQRMTFHSWLVFGGIVVTAFAVITVQGLRGAQTPLDRVTRVTTPNGAATASEGSGSIDSRVAIYKVAVERIEADPFVGVGLDLVSVTKPFGIVSYEYDVHNLVLGTWYKAGLFGVVGMVLTIFAILRTGAATLAASVSEDERRTAAGLISGVVAFTVFAMSEPVLFSRFGWIPAALLLGLRMVQQRRTSAQETTSATPTHGRPHMRLLPGLSS
jgi:O-antigen/teichoic acid export membrane protein/O-antigen ligase